MAHSIVTLPLALETGSSSPSSSLPLKMRLKLQPERAATTRCAPPLASTSKPSGDDAGALAAEIDRRGLVRHGDAFSSRHKGVSWDKQAQTWRARLKHGGKTPKLGYFGTEAEAKGLAQLLFREPGPVCAVVKVVDEDLPMTVPPRDGGYLKTRFRIGLLGEEVATRP